MDRFEIPDEVLSVVLEHESDSLQKRLSSI